MRSDTHRTKTKMMYEKTIDRWMDGCVCVCGGGGLVGGWVDGWMDGWREGWMDGWIDTCIDK